VVDGSKLPNIGVLSVCPQSPVNNGHWVEEVLMKKLPGPYLGQPPNPQHHHWSQATTVNGDGLKTPFTNIDSDYPPGADGKPMHFGVNLQPAPQ
jgi:hypothetical protein